MVDLAGIHSVFERAEKKYLVPDEKFAPLAEAMRAYMTEDEYGQYTICNIYYDTDSDELIRRSLGKPKYKEKIRLRSYGVPQEDTLVFLELKKKMNGIVYNRRISLPYESAYNYLGGGVLPEGCDRQILLEIDYFIRYYQPVPKLYLAYDRIAFCGADDPGLRITFDTDIRSRRHDLELSKGDYGAPLFMESEHLMEIKAGAAMPLWLTRLLSDFEIYPISFSKYGKIYLKNLQWKEEDVCLPV